jgi:ketosteroid isomerase-like protein
MSAENVQLLRRIYERWRVGDFHTESYYADDFTFALGPDFPDQGVYQGREAVKSYMRGFLDPWEELTIAPEELIDGDSMVLVRVLQSGKGVGSGVAVELRYFHLWTFDGSKPVRMESIMEEADAVARFEQRTDVT